MNEKRLDMGRPGMSMQKYLATKIRFFKKGSEETRLVIRKSHWRGKEGGGGTWEKKNLKKLIRGRSPETKVEGGHARILLRKAKTRREFLGGEHKTRRHCDVGQKKFAGREENTAPMTSNGAAGSLRQNWRWE